MGQKLAWTPARDSTLLRLRSQSATWGEIAAALNISPNAAFERGRRIGARLPPRVLVRIVAEDPDRPAHPPGHFSTWGSLTAGTILEGISYPPLPPMGRDRAGVVGEVC